MTPSIPDTTWIKRCFDLAKRGLGHVSPNPPVGAVLVYDHHILSEGYHTHFGGPHAEVAAIGNVPASEHHLIPRSTLFISLEPCCVSGKTPPCTDLIIQEGIKDVRISTKDPNKLVSGRGIEILRSNGISVTEGILEEEGQHLIRTFNTNIQNQRPHIILKWAQSRWGYSGHTDRQIWFSHRDTKVWTHQLRAETDAILVGARTVVRDNPELTTRNYPGRSPHRVIYDPNNRLDLSFAVFQNDGQRVYYFSKKINPAITASHIELNTFEDQEDHLGIMLDVLFRDHIGVLLVEGGAYLQNRFIKENRWDEAWVIQTPHPLDAGIRAPNVYGTRLGMVSSAVDTIIGIRNVIR